MNTYPKTIYQVGSSMGATFIQQRTLLRETAKWWVIADRWNSTREDRLFKKNVTIFFTFDEAKADLVKRKQRQIAKYELELTLSREQLAKAEALTGPTHVDDPVPPPAGPIRI